VERHLFLDPPPTEKEKKLYPPPRKLSFSPDPYLQKKLTNPELNNFNI
jgi:hypothetical protein